MANIFPTQKLAVLATKADVPELEEKLKLVNLWLEDYRTGSLKTDKETSREQAYNQDIFIKILGYKEKPSNPYSFEPKASTAAGQLPDAIVGHLTKTADNLNQIVSAVIELKGAAILLDKPQRREGNMSPVQQGFKYKIQYKHCPFVIVSNFYEFRLYQDNQLDYEVWTLQDLANPKDNYLKFKTFYYLLNYDNFVPTNGGGKSKTEELLSDIRIEQEDIGKKFYRVYKLARDDLLRNLYKNNVSVRADIDLGIEKAQKIIDRIVFACFAEDRGLLPDNTLQRVLKVDESAFGGLWDTLKGFFNAIDTGSAKLEIPDGYNGGLFAVDNKLNELVIDDEPLKALAELSRYDFQEELSVQILGHIFEQSISDLEAIKKKANEAIGKVDIETTNKRKKDGIYYTPDYIVKYIVENSLGAYLQEAEDKCKQEANLKGDINDKNYDKRERKAYINYQKILQEVTVCDPACGSGAFLVQVFDYLLAENKRVADILDANNTTLLDFHTDTYFKSILENNIYGVDLNYESVEITKLSLWLKSAQKGKKLTNLNSNIKCGNSLIDDPAVAGDKAFNWKEQFPEVFRQGGFDVIMGNPPYGVSFSKEEKKHLLKFDDLVPDYETYIYFLSLYKHILRRNGVLSYIFPNTFLSTVYGKKYRIEILSETQVFGIVDLSNDITFNDASVRTCILTLKHSNNNYSCDLSKVSHKVFEAVSSYRKAEILDEVDNILALFSLNKPEKSLVGKIISNTSLSNFVEISQGLIPYDKYRGHDEYTIKNRIWHSDHKKDSTYKKELKGGDVHRYSLDWNGKLWISYGKWLAAPRENKFFVEERILIREITAKKLDATLTKEEYYNTPSLINIINKSNTLSLKFVLAILNSSLIGWLHNKISPKANKGLFPKILINDVRKIPIINASKLEQRSFMIHTDKMLTLNDELLILHKRFEYLLITEFCLDKWPSRLGAWWELEFDDFVKALKLKLDLAQKDDLLTLFEKYQPQLVELKAKIDQTDKEIDQMVYKLYNLTPEEIQLIEE